jgi:hypothetical protein
MINPPRKPEWFVTGDDPFSRFRLTVQGGGNIGGGSPSSPIDPLGAMRKISPNGAAPASGDLLRQVVFDHHLLATLEGGGVPVLALKNRQIVALAEIDQELEQTFAPMWDVGRWNQWMKGIVDSRSIPTTVPGAIFHDNKVDGGLAAGKFHYRAEMFLRDTVGGKLITWNDETGRLQRAPGYETDVFRRAPGFRGASCRGFWAFAAPQSQEGKLLNDKTIMCYSILFLPDFENDESQGMLGRFVNKAKKKAMETDFVLNRILAQVVESITDMANRAVDPAWPQNGRKNPCGKKYSLIKFVD